VAPAAEQPTLEGKLHWERVYGGSDPHELSWYQREPALSLELLDGLGIEPGEALADVGGGSSHLVERLLDRGFTDLTVLDISESALAGVRARLGARAETVSWLVEDIRAWRPSRQFDVWHDRALFHFLVDRADRDRYAETVRHAVRPGGAVVIATFALDGPETCSGLPVHRYDVAGIAAVLGPGAELVAESREEHVTPRGRVQPFTWAALRLRA
jgi:SAM-dependent methyltransferase